MLSLSSFFRYEQLKPKYRVFFLRGFPVAMVTCTPQKKKKTASCLAIDVSHGYDNFAVT